MNITFVREPEARRRLGDISRSTFFRMRRDGLMPEPVVIRGKNYFVVEDLDKAILRLASPNTNQSPALVNGVNS